MKITRVVLRCIAFFWVLILSLSTLPYLSFNSDMGFLQIKQFAVKTGWYLPAFYCHIFGSSVILLAGFFQFSKWVYTRRRLHKILGKIYVFGVLFFASPGAFVMTLFIHRGTGVFISFLLQNTLWVIFTLSAWVLIKKGDVDGHVKMMRRSYALAFAAINLRLYTWLFHQFDLSLDFQYNYLTIAFLSWVPNLIIAELLNYYDKTTISPIQPAPGAKA